MFDLQIGAPLLPGAKAPASRHPNDDRGVQCAGILSLLAEPFPVDRQSARGQKRQAPGSAVRSAFPGVLELSDRPALSLPEGRPMEATGDYEP
jgi:hypothetical protein